MIKQESRAYFRALGAHISTLRKEQGLTQAELSRLLGVSQQTVFSYELGDRRVSVLTLVKLAKIFGVSIEELAGHDRRGSPETPSISGRNTAMPRASSSSAKPSSAS